MPLAEAHEHRVKHELENRGWHVDLYGQGQLSPENRDALMSLGWTCHLRWLPDLLASRAESNRMRVAWIDAKDELNDDTPNFSLELDANIAHLKLQAVFGIPIVYVWGDLTCSKAADIRRTDVRYPKRGTVVGSGTPFMLIPKREQLPLDALFGHPTGGQGAA